jgi:asparagine synthase (glutamine-hydrolysing)
MGVQYGIWTFDRASIATQELADVRAALAAGESERVFEHTEAAIQMLYLPFHARSESERDEQPFRSCEGQVVIWDGRLDNREELMASLRTELRKDPADVAIVATALQLWGIAALGKFLGDWALSAWDPKERIVILARDFLGTKPLYYKNDEGSFSWSTRIDPLLRSKKQASHFQEEYLAGWFLQFPGTNLTPFAGIHSVPPASYVLVRPRKTVIRQYWNFDSAKRVRHQDDRGYEEHFRALFEQSVRRRLRSTTPVLAELSGGMDSSSIVCMADLVLSRGHAETARLDTISFYDHSEPNWNEGAYFNMVEQRRGHAGLHLPVNFRNSLRPCFPAERFAPTPGSGDSFNENERYAAYLRSGQYRVLLQGLGGDEVLGGIPAPSPELADLLICGQIRTFAKSLMAWSLAARVPVFRLTADVFGEYFPARFPSRTLDAAPWLRPEFVRRNREALLGYEPTRAGWSVRPSLRANLQTLDYLRRYIGCLASSANNLERRFPYLDRDLLEFLYAVPREQLLRPNQRRSLMRRALRGIVPDEILNRKRKAFISRGPIVAIQQELPLLLQETNRMLSTELGIVDNHKFQQHLKRAAEGQDQPVVPLLRTLLLEAWLRHVSRWFSCNASPGFLENLRTEVHMHRSAPDSFS